MLRPTAGPEDPGRMVTIYRDSYGIPHVFGATDAATAFGFGYAQAEDNFCADRRQLHLRHSDGARRSLARPAGRRTARTARSRFPGSPARSTPDCPRKMRALVDGFVAGINSLARPASRDVPAPAAAHRALVSTRLHPLQLLPEWLCMEFADRATGSSQLRWSRLPDGSTSTGSNGWVIGPSRSATGHAMLFINPHLPFFGPGPGV